MDHGNTSEQLITAGIESFLNTLHRNPSDGQTGLRNLAIALDRLVYIYFKLEATEPETQTDPPSVDYAPFGKMAAEAYPELGLYPYADPGGDAGETECLVADAIDDLADIARDLTGVLWCLENTDLSDAIWEYRFGYQTHWGTHLHSLRHYLNSSRIGAW